MQALAQGDPVTSAELKEMTVRHILSAPHDRRLATLTACLFDAYITSKHGELVMASHIAAGPLMERYYLEAHPLTPWSWPSAIPSTLLVYPRDILIEVAAALGMQSAETVLDEAN
jgi:hypothetical protein